MNLVLESFAWYSPRQISLGFLAPLAISSCERRYHLDGLVRISWPYVTASPKTTRRWPSLIYADDVEVNFRTPLFPGLALSGFGNRASECAWVTVIKRALHHFLMLAKIS